MSSTALTLVSDVIERCKALNDEVRADGDITELEARAVVKAAREGVGWLLGIIQLLEVG